MVKNKIRYLALLAVIAVLSILYNDYYMGMIFLTVAALPFLMFGLLSYIYGKVRADILSTVHVAGKGEMIPVTIRINNPTRFPISNITISFTYSNSFSRSLNKKEISASADKRSNTTVICNIISEHAGNLEINLCKIRIFDYLKMFSLSRKQKGEIRIAILPYLHEISDDYLSSRCKMLVESDYFSSVRSGDDPSEVFAIREYREGDRLQRIHWKLSKKLDQLMIKDFSEPLNCSILVFANLSVPSKEDILVYMDSLLECALSLSYSFLLKGQIHYFSWYDELHGICQRVRIVNEKDLYEAVDQVLQSIPYSEGTDVMTAYLAEHPNDQYTDMFYVTGEVSKEQLYSLSIIKANIRQIMYVNNISRMQKAVGERQSVNLPIAEEVMRKIAEMGIGLLSIDTSNLKHTMEGLKLG